MFKGNRKYIVVFSALFVLVVAAQYLLPTPTDWSRSYLRRSKAPFGCYALYNVLDSALSRNYWVSEKTLFLLNDGVEDSTSLLIVNDVVDFNRNDMRALYELLDKGSSVMIAANGFGTAFFDSLNVRTETDYYSYFTNPNDSLLMKDDKAFGLTASNLRKKTYNYPRLLGTSYFSSFDTSLFRINAFFDTNHACLISAPVGNGRLYLMSVPDLFGNYFIANHKNRGLAYAMLSPLKNKTLVWDEHYKTYNVNQYSMLKFVLSNDALYAAYLMMLFTIVLYMVFESRRRQRVIPIVAPPANSTLEFVNVISHVYYNSHNHAHIAAERTRYFYELVRRKFHVSTEVMDEAFFSDVSERSGIELKKVKQLFAYCEQLKAGGEITEYDLVELNRQIHNFNKNSLR